MFFICFQYNESFSSKSNLVHFPFCNFELWSPFDSVADKVLLNVFQILLIFRIRRQKNVANVCVTVWRAIVCILSDCEIAGTICSISWAPIHIMMRRLNSSIWLDKLFLHRQRENKCLCSEIVNILRIIGWIPGNWCICTDNISSLSCNDTQIVLSFVT